MSISKRDLLEHIVMLLIAFGLASTSLNIINNATLMYALSLISIFVIEYLINSSIRQTHQTYLKYYLLFVFSLFLTNALNQIFDYRYFLFMAILIITAPWNTSPGLIRFRKQLLESICLIFVLITFACFICYIIGYNGPIRNDIDYNPLDFRGITNHPMWLAPICGITNIYMLTNLYKTTKWRRIFLISMLCISIYLSVAAASRSSLLASCVAMLFILYIKSKNVGKFIKITICVSVIALISIPYLDTERMEGKMETQQESGTLSRDGLWKQRIAEINDSPFFGVGFATSGIGNKKETGRMESGSGWLSVVSQTGIVGLLCMLILLSKATMKKKWLKNNDELLFVTSIFLFLCIHSFFEGYIYTPGYNLCVLFWLLLGILIEYRTIIERCYK